jgi:hypothetical protein
MIKKVLIPSDPKQFKQELLRTKRAKRLLLYRDGSQRVEWWDAYKFTPSSNLMGNISSQLWHRRDKAKIIEAIYGIEEEDRANRFCDIEDTNSGDLYIHYKKGWSSFRPVDEHVVEYIIENGEITISYNVGFGPGKTITKKITDKDMRELVCIMDEAVAKGTLVKSNTVIRTVHGTICGYDYDYRGYSERDCCSLFTDDSLNARYSRLIDKIIK